MTSVKANTSPKNTRPKVAGPKPAAPKTSGSGSLARSQFGSGAATSITGLEDRFGYLGGCLFIKDEGICVASDIHIGLEDELRRQGLAFPLKEGAMLKKKFLMAIDKFRPETFVLAGDIFHSFNRLDNRAKAKFDSIMTALESRCDVVLLRGSHDTMLQAAGKEALDRYDIEGFTLCHGHALLDRHGHLVMGHEHPVIQIDMERHPCFLHGTGVLDGRDLTVLPAFNPLCQGVTINHVEGRDFLSPMLRKVDTGELSPVVEFEGEVLEFPRLRGLRRHID